MSRYNKKLTGGLANNRMEPARSPFRAIISLRRAAHSDALSPAPTSQLQRSQPRDQGGVVSPPGFSWIATHSRRLTQLHRGLFHAHRDFLVPIRGLQADVSEPAADHIHFDAGFEEMYGGRVPKHVRRDPTRRRRGGFETRGMLPHAFVDA